MTARTKVVARAVLLADELVFFLAGLAADKLIQEGLVAGPKKQQQEAHAVKDPKTGKMVVSSEEIKRG